LRIYFKLEILFYLNTILQLTVKGRHIHRGIYEGFVRMSLCVQRRTGVNCGVKVENTKSCEMWLEDTQSRTKWKINLRRLENKSPIRTVT